MCDVLVFSLWENNLKVCKEMLTYGGLCTGCTEHRERAHGCAARSFRYCPQFSGSIEPNPVRNDTAPYGVSFTGSIVPNPVRNNTAPYGVSFTGSIEPNPVRNNTAPHVGWVTCYPRFTRPSYPRFTKPIEPNPMRNNTAPHVGWVTCYPRFTRPIKPNPVRNELHT